MMKMIKKGLSLGQARKARYAYGPLKQSFHQL
jgi:hypothetical protein